MSDRPRISAARRNAEAVLSTAQKRESDFKLEQQRARRTSLLGPRRRRNEVEHDRRQAGASAPHLSLPSGRSGRS